MHPSSLMSLLRLFNSTQAGKKILGSAQETTQPLQSGVHAITGQQVGPGHSYLLQQQPFGASTWRSGGAFSPAVPQAAKSQGSGLGFLPRLGERCRAHGRAAASEGRALPGRLQWHCCPLPTPTSLTWAQARYVWNLLEALQARATSHSHWRLLWNKHTLSRRLHLQGLRTRRRHQVPPPWLRKTLAHVSRLGKVPAATYMEFYSN